MIFVATAALLVLSLIVLSGRHFLISVALSVALFLFAHVSPVLVIAAYLAVYVGLQVALFGAAALLLKGKLGFVMRLLGFAGRRG